MLLGKPCPAAQCWLLEEGDGERGGDDDAPRRKVVVLSELREPNKMLVVCLVNKPSSSTATHQDQATASAIQVMEQGCADLSHKAGFVVVSLSAHNKAHALIHACQHVCIADDDDAGEAVSGWASHTPAHFIVNSAGQVAFHTQCPASPYLAFVG